MSQPYRTPMYSVIPGMNQLLLETTCSHRPEYAEAVQYLLAEDC